MSLKAKIEAVIYASEEPVTLAQLIGLLWEEAQAELDRQESLQQTFLLDEAGGPELEADDVAEAAAEEPATGESGEAFGAQVALPQVEVEQSTSQETVEPEPEGEIPLDTEPSDEGGAPGELGQPEAELASAGEIEVEDEGAAPAEHAQETSNTEAVDDAGVEVSAATEGAEVPESGEAQVTESDPAAAAKAEKARAARLRQYFRSVLDKLIADYADAESDRGLEIREVGGGFRFATKPEYHDAVRGFVKSLKPPLKLSLQALETLAVVAYKQPVTAPEVSEIRGVDSAGVLGSLIGRKLVTTAGRKQVIGRPILYKTTKDFLLKFGLKDLSELPSIEEFEKMAGQMAEQEEIPMPEPREQERHTDAANPGGSGTSPDELAEMVERQRNTHEPQPDGYSGAAENVSEETGDKASVDGRISSLPPDYAGEESRENPSAQDAEAQGRE